ncbi:MAG: TetR-like C-terminal domain-containing protein, partial [Pseudohongiellaceae bacterium]
MFNAHYHFARGQPARFQILFSSTLPLEWSTQELVEVSCRNIVRLRKLVLAIYEQHQIPCGEEDVVNTTLLIWSQLHGIIGRKCGARQRWRQGCGSPRAAPLRGSLSPKSSPFLRSATLRYVRVCFLRSALALDCG